MSTFKVTLTTGASFAVRGDWFSARGGKTSEMRIVRKRRLVAVIDTNYLRSLEIE